MVLLAWPESGNSSEKGGAFTYGSADEYREMLEREVKKIIKGVPGVGDCEVMITLKTGYEYYYAADQQVVSGETAADSRREFILAGYDGNEQPVLIEERMPKVSGVAVVCPGVSAGVEYQILKALGALFDLPLNRVSVIR